MKHIAFNGGVRIGETLEAGEVEITSQQYLDLIEGMASAKEIAIESGMVVIKEPPEPVEPEPVITKDDVDRERNRRLAQPFSFNGKMFQRDNESLKRITGAVPWATIAVMNGAQPGDLRWNGGDEDFGWIAEDNTIMPMDAQTVIAFGQACAALELPLIRAARAIKDMVSIPDDYATNEAYWP
jgi:hypothetical protein